MKFNRGASIIHVSIKGILGVLMASSVWASEPKKDDKAAVGSVAKPWIEVETRVSGLTTKSEQAKARLDGLISEKKKMRDAAAMAKKDKEISQAYKEWKEVTEELEKQKAIFRYRFPEKAAKSEVRIYESRGDVPSLEKVEEQIGIEGKINRNLRRLRGQYGEAASSPKKSNSESVSATPTPSPGEDLTIREQHSPVFRK